MNPIVSPQPAATKQQEQDEDRQRQQRRNPLSLLPRPASNDWRSLTLTHNLTFAWTLIS
jgi:hypothetical protein